jgi:hypothetical protein
MVVPSALMAGKPPEMVDRLEHTNEGERMKRGAREKKKTQIGEHRGAYVPNRAGRQTV